MKLRKTITSKVAGQEVEFRAINFKIINRFRKLARVNKDISDLIAYWINKGQVRTEEIVSQEIENEDGTKTTINQVAATPAQTVAMNHEVLKKGITAVIDVISSSELVELCLEALATCTLDIDEMEGMSIPEKVEFLKEEVDPDNLMEIGFGVIKASSGSLVHLGKRLGLSKDTVEELIQKVTNQD